MARKPERYPALYERLSHDDELQGESNSISNQKRILEDYAEQHGFTNCIHFTDDGISGTQFDRPGFQKMIAEVKADRISVVIIKDMSRFGRDYLQVGTYMEVLRKHDTRLIALNDSVDTLKGDDEYVCYTTAFFFCRRPVDHSIFMKLGAWQIHGEKYLHQLPKRVVLPGLPISHTAYRYSFVPPTGAK